MKPPAPRPTLIIDTREPLETALVFSDAVDTIRACMPEGDYGVRHGDAWLALFERKSKDDLVSSLTFERARFVAECERLARHPFRAVVVEAPLSDFAGGLYTSRATPASIVGSIAAIYADFALPFLFAGSPQGAAFMVEKIVRRLHARAIATPETSP